MFVWAARTQLVYINWDDSWSNFLVSVRFTIIVLGEKWQWTAHDSYLTGAIIQLQVIAVRVYGKENMIRVWEKCTLEDYFPVYGNK